MSDSRHNFITIDKASLKYTKWPGGDKIMLCFHGFGQEHSVFRSVYEVLKETHSLYSFDLFFHGESQWDRGEKSFYPQDWFDFMEAFFAEEEIGCFEVMGFSMGGKFALITAQLFPKQTDHLHLLSPDGIKTHFSYRFSTYPLLFRKIFKTQIRNPSVFKGIVNLTRRLKLMNNYTLRFAETQMNTEFKRAQVYYSWVIFRHFMPDLKKIADIINHSPTTLTFYLGKYDKVINKKEMQHLIDLLDDYELKEIESGHSRLIEGVAKVLR